MGVQINIRFMPKLNGEGTNLQICGLRARTDRRPEILAYSRLLQLFLLRQVNTKWVLIWVVKKKAREQIR